MLTARKFFIFFVTFFTAGVIQLHAQQESNCYVAASVEDNDKAASNGNEEIQGEAKIDMKFQNGIQKNWNVIAKELGFRDIKEMIKVHKEHENWDNYKKYFNNPNKFDKAIFLSQGKVDYKIVKDPSFLSEIAVSMISRYMMEVEPIPLSGISSDACIYNVLLKITESSLIITLTGKDLNTIGESRKKNKDGVQEAILRALYNTFETKREDICNDYGSFLSMECTLLSAKKEVEKDECLLDVNTGSEDQSEIPDQKLVAEIATSLISQYLVKVKYFEKTFIEDYSTTAKEKEEFVKKIDQILSKSECLYKVFPKQKDESILITLSGEDLNAYGSSKKSGADGLQEAMLIALYRGLKSQRGTICRDYGEILAEQCTSEDTAFDKQDANFRIRGFFHSYEGSNYNLSNISYSITLKDWGFAPSILSNAGIGQTFLNYESKSSSGADFIASVTSLDISKTYVIEGGPKNTLNKFRSIVMDLLPIKSTSGEWFIIPGMGIVLSNIIPIPFIYEGELDIKSQYGDFSSEEAFGYSFFGNLGMEIGEWEMLLGLRWSKMEFSDIASGAENFVFSGTSFMFGLGWGF
jgi:hypothetical protein